MLPGMSRKAREQAMPDPAKLKRFEAILLSMTPRERRLPRLIDGSRRRRIAAGSGSSVQQVNQLLGQFKQVQKMMRQIGRGKMPQFPGMGTR